ncbi:MAG: pyridoxal-phosphate dependent enzyme [Bacteroidia bacterium]|nr:pyridoxal-phosphate dependent enzyme [Bacteroidia bacterium]
MKEKILDLSDPELLGQSRVHALHSFSSADQKVYVKREDETGFSISGTKRRKYASLLPYLEQRGIKEVILMGGEHSNHLPAIIQLLRERGIRFKVCVKKSHPTAKKGNRFLLHLLIQEEEIEYLDSASWKHAEAYLLDKYGSAAFILPEGASCKASLAGAGSLGLDLRRNEEELKLSFSHLFLDAGTGMSAAGMILAQSQLKHPAHIHVTLMAGEKEEFLQQLHTYARDWEEIFGEKISEFPPLHLYYPPSAKSFGSINREVLKIIREMALKEGLLLDPIYNAKLFQNAFQQINEQQLMGNICIIHSGGGSGLMGFAEKFA